MIGFDKYAGERSVKVLKVLTEAGFEAYFVGGCVRDFLLERERPGDIDITTSARPEQVKNLFSDMKIVDTGIKHGTVTVIAGADRGDRASDAGEDEEKGRDEKKLADTSLKACNFQREPVSFEITTYRHDGDYSDHRHPDRVGFVSSLEEDLARRDFTINAIACDEKGNIRDPFGGREDIKKRVIRTVGIAEKRFEEDALRILRALRFAAVLGFSIEEKTERAMFSRKKLIRSLSAERCFGEFKKLICGSCAGEVVRRYADILGELFPELLKMKGFKQCNSYHRYDVLEHCIRAMEAVETTDENCEYMKLAALFHDVGKPETFSRDEKGTGHFYGHPSAGSKIVLQMLERLKADSFTTERVAKIIKHHDMIFEKEPGLLKRWMNRFTPQLLLEILRIKRADNIATGNMSRELFEKFDDIEKMIGEILAEQQCFSLKDLAVNGKDLIKEGMKPGPQMGKLLEQLLEMVVEEKVPNEKSRLLEEAAGLMRDSRADEG